MYTDVYDVAGGGVAVSEEFHQSPETRKQALQSSGRARLGRQSLSLQSPGKARRQPSSSPSPKQSDPSPPGSEKEDGEPVRGEY